MVDGKCRGRYTASRSAIAAPRECPVRTTLVEPVAAWAFFTAARTPGAELWQDYHIGLNANRKRDKPRMSCQKPAMGFQSCWHPREECLIQRNEEKVSIGQKRE
jgi:hypothetical protein